MKIGDIVIYRESSGIPSRHGINIHPAIVNYVYPASIPDMQKLDLTVFFHGYQAEAVMDVPIGNINTDSHCWWERE